MLCYFCLYNAMRGQNVNLPMCVCVCVCVLQYNETVQTRSRRRVEKVLSLYLQLGLFGTFLSWCRRLFDTTQLDILSTKHTHSRCRRCIVLIISTRQDFFSFYTNHFITWWTDADKNISQYSTVVLTVVRVMIAKYRKSGIWGYRSSLTPEPIELK